MTDGPRGKTGRMGLGLRATAEHQAVEIYNHQQRSDALSRYAPVVIPLLRHAVSIVFGETPGYGVDDNIETDSDAMRFGWRIFGLSRGEATFRDDTPQAPVRKTLLAVEIVFSDTGQPTGFLVDTRRTHTTVKTGLLGLKQKINTTLGGARQVPLNEAALVEALDEMLKIMER